MHDNRGIILSDSGLKTFRELLVVGESFAAEHRGGGFGCGVLSARAPMLLSVDISAAH